MVVLNAQKRNTGLKPKQLRRKGIVPGVLYGKNLEESLSVQFSQAETARFLKSNAEGSKADLLIDGKKFPALLREITYKSVSGELEHLSFQTLLAGEVITSVARIIPLNRDKVLGVLHQPQPEISYRALPSHLIEKIEIDLDGMKVEDSIRISDLDIAKNPDVEILTPLDTVLLFIADARKAAEPLADENEEDGEKTESE